MKNFFVSLLFITINSHASQGVLAQKKFLASSFECIPKDTRQVCLDIIQANDYEAISRLSLNAFMSSKKEIKSLKNRVSITECCLVMNNGKSCEGLIPEAKEIACACRKRLNLSPGMGLACKK